MTPMEEGKSVNEYIFPYINFTLSEDGSYYTAEIVEGASVSSVYIASVADYFDSSIPILKFEGFENPSDAVNLKSITFESSQTSFSSELFIYADNLETFTVENVDSTYPVYTDLAVVEKRGYEFDGWYVKGTDVKRVNGDRIFPGLSTLEPRWKEHELVYVAKKDATCTQDGKKAHYKCSSCSKLFLDEKAYDEVTEEDLIIAASHTLEYVEKVDATCTEPGNRAYYKCTVCGRLFSDADGKFEISNTTIDALGHAVYFVKEKEATCTEDGVKEHYECSRCDGLFTDEERTGETTLKELKISALGHDWQRQQSSASLSCSWDECKRCHETKDPVGHTWDSGVVSKEPTATEHGEMLYTCVSCGYKKTEDIKPLDSSEHIHSWVDSTPVAPTCTTRGYTLVTCSECGIQYESNYKNAIGHTMTAVDAKDPTCLEDGNIKYYICSKCPDGENLYLDINGINSTDKDYITDGKEALEHDWSKVWTTDDSGHWHKCNRCGAVDDKAEHVYNQKVEKDEYLKADATCTTKAVYYYSCVCGKEGTETFESGSPLGHENETKHERVESTCQTQGHIEYWTCSRTCCKGKYYLDENFSSLTTNYTSLLLPYAHVFSNKYETTETKHTLICDKCGRPVETTGNHEFSWKHTDYLHWKECTVCGYKKNEGDHVLEGEIGKRICYTCGFEEAKAEDAEKEGFDVVVIDRKPSGYLTSTRNGTEWTFTLESTNDEYAKPTSYIWYVNGELVDGHESTYTLSAPGKHTYRVMCVFSANGYYASDSTLITGGEE